MLARIDVLAIAHGQIHQSYSACQSAVMAHEATTDRKAHVTAWKLPIARVNRSPTKPATRVAERTTAVILADLCGE